MFTAANRCLVLKGVPRSVREPVNPEVRRKLLPPAGFSRVLRTVVLVGRWVAPLIRTTIRPRERIYDVPDSPWRTPL